MRKWVTRFLLCLTFPFMIIAMAWITVWEGFKWVDFRDGVRDYIDCIKRGFL